MLAGMAAAAPSALAAEPAWMPIEALSDPDEQVRFLDADVAADGTAVAVWERAVGESGWVIRAASRPERGVSFARPQDLSPPGTGGLPLPAVAVDQADNAVVAWLADDRRVMASFRVGATGEWATPTAVSPPGALPPAEVALAPGGEAVALWPMPGVGIQAAVRSPQTGGWSPPATVLAGGPVPPVFSARTTPDGTQVVWTSSALLLRPPGGQFGPPQPLPAGFDGSLTVTPQGEVIALRIAPAEESGTVEAAIRPPGAAFGPFEPVATAEGHAAELPRLTVDDEGGAIAMWHLRPRPGESGGPMGRLMVAERPAGGPWSARRLDVGRAGGILSALAGNGAGRVVGLLSHPTELLAAVRSGSEGRLAAETVARAQGDALIVVGGSLVGVEAGGRATAVLRRGERAFASTRRIEPGEAPALTAAQLRVNQRISAAAVRRANAAIRVIEQGLGAERIRPGAFTARVFAPGVMLTGQPSGALRPPRAPVPVEVAPPGTVDPGAVALSARQFLINQRISQAAVRRANALLALLDGELTGGNLRRGSVTPELLAPGLSVAEATASGAGAPAARVAVGGRAARPSSAVRLTAQQLLINQRISQAAVRRTNEVIARLESGLSGTSFASGSIGSAALGSSGG